MQSFVNVLFAFIFLFSILFLKLTFTDPKEHWPIDNHSYFDALKVAFMMLMVDSDVKTFDTIWGFALYFLASMILVVVMLNLLIATIGDSYDKVKAMEL